MLNSRGHVPTEDYQIPFGKAAVARNGTDATIVALSIMVNRVLDIAEDLSLEGVSLEVIDPRTAVSYTHLTLPTTPYV